MKLGLGTYSSLATAITSAPIKKDKTVNYLYLSYNTIKLVKKFLEKHDTFYSKKFIEVLKKNKLIFNKKAQDGYLINSKKISVNRRMTVDDSLAMIHEFLHYINHFLNPSKKDEIFKEVNSFTYESFLADYLIEKGYDDARYQLRRNMYEDYCMAINAKKELELQKYLSESKLSKCELTERLKEYVSDVKSNYTNASIEGYSPYLMGSLLSSYIHQNILSKDLSIEDYKKIRDALIKEEYKDLGKMLDLDFIIDKSTVDIGYLSVKKLEKTYLDEVKYYGG